MITLQAFDPADCKLHVNIVRLWGEACAAQLPLSPRLLAFNTEPTPDIKQTACLALRGSELGGFVLASVGDTIQDRATGWIDVLAVAPAMQRQGIGHALLEWAEERLATQGCITVRLGGSLRPFTPGLPMELGAMPFFERYGYEATGEVYDVARRLSDYQPLRIAPAGHITVEPVQSSQVQLLLAFLHTAFPERWEGECREYLRRGGQSSDYLALWVDGSIEGFCQVAFEDSLRPIERFFPGRLPRPWGQLGPIGVGRSCRGKGYGAFLLDAGLRYLSAKGVDGCVIDWTDLTAFYEKFGFTVYRQYVKLVKLLRHPVPV
ncbi:MAG: GNAT family N-acetyltransferase [Chloroflexales bacterium]|nr:GNAT family N-acetyltransferase [Chloroflexales bacterium]